jgi:hypothetical protein
MGGIIVYCFIFGEFPDVDFLKTIPYKESSQIRKRRLLQSCCVCGVVVYPILELLCVWCGSVPYPRAVVCVVW